MGTLYIGSKAMFVDDETGMYWDCVRKTQRLNPDGTPFVEAANASTAILENANEAKKSEAIVATASVEVKMPVNPLACTQCDYVAPNEKKLKNHKWLKSHF